MREHSWAFISQTVELLGRVMLSPTGRGKNLILCVHVVYKHMCNCCVSAYVCGHMWRPEVNTGCLLWSHSTLFIEIESLTWTPNNSFSLVTQLAPGTPISISRAQAGSHAHVASTEPLPQPSFLTTWNLSDCSLLHNFVIFYSVASQRRLLIT